MGQYTGDLFRPLVGQIFHFHRTEDTSDPALHLELLEVQLPRQATSGARQSFSLLFALQKGDATSESTLYLQHGDFEPCAWFINRVAVPGRDAQTAYYEAVFG